jgi:hypothetical protein
MRWKLAFCLIVPLWGVGSAQGAVTMIGGTIIGETFGARDNNRTVWANKILDNTQAGMPDTGNFDTELYAVKHIGNTILAKYAVETDDRYATHYMWAGNGSPTGAFATLMGGGPIYEVDIKGNGQQLKIANLAVNGSFGYTGGYDSFTARGRVGTTWLTSGNANTLVDEIVLWTSDVGISSYIFSTSAAGSPQWQQDINNAMTNLVGTTLSSGPIEAYSDNHSVAPYAAITLDTMVVAVPEPGSLVFLGLGSLLLCRKRKA